LTKTINITDADRRLAKLLRVSLDAESSFTNEDLYGGLTREGWLQSKLENAERKLLAVTLMFAVCVILAVSIELLRFAGRM
jgi:hypothetical protein